MDIEKFEDDQRDKIEQEIKDERTLGLENIEEEAKKIRDEKLGAFEKRLKDMKNRGLANRAEEEFADMMAKYGD